MGASFLRSDRSIRLSEIANELEYTVVGDPTLEIASFRYAADADENSLAIAFKPDDVRNTRARSVLLSPTLIPTDKTLVYCGFKDMKVAPVLVAKFMIRAGLYPDYGRAIEQTPRDEFSGSLFGSNVEIGKGTTIAPFVSVGNDVVIGRNCRIEANVNVGSGTRIGNDVIIRGGARVGANCNCSYRDGRRLALFDGIGRTVIGDGVTIGCNSVIQRGTFSDTIIGDGTILGNLVELAHDVKVGVGCLLVSQVGICGNVTIGNDVEIYGQSGVVDRVTIGDGATVMAKSVVTRNVASGKKISGTYGREHIRELKFRAKLRRMIEEE